MAKKSLVELQEQIAKLQAQAEQLREQEKAGVVARIREAIEAYDLKEEDLFGSPARGRQARPGAVGAKRPVAYADGKGNQWGGRGPRPRWLREALKQGTRLEDLAAGSGRARRKPAAAAAAAPAVAGAPKSPGRAPIKFRDESGNSWSGRGSQPKWLRQALADGHSLESFKVAD